MGLRQLLAAAAVRRISVLVVEAPGWGRTRCAVEAELRRRGWRLALSPADADALLVCGQPGDRLRAAVELVWEQLPGPRAQAEVTRSADVAGALNELEHQLADDPRQRQDAARRSTEPAMGTPPPGAEDGETGDSDSDSENDAEDGSEETADSAPEQDQAQHDDMQHAGDTDPDEMGGMTPGDGGDMGGMDHGDGHDDMAGMDHGDMGGMDMPMPGGIPLAGGAQDRDGLEMDVLHVPLGPVLPAWPAGLVLRCTLSGDVVTEASACVLESAAAAPEEEQLVTGSPAERLDRAARLLALSGWEDAATSAARLRDQTLFSDDLSETTRQVQRLAGRVRRSRLLRWSVSARGDAPAVDAYAEVCRLLEDAGRVLSGTRAPVALTPPEVLAERVVGRQLASVRLLVAATQVDAALVPAGAGAS